MPNDSEKLINQPVNFFPAKQLDLDKFPQISKDDIDRLLKDKTNLKVETINELLVTVEGFGFATHNTYALIAELGRLRDSMQGQLDPKATKADTTNFLLILKSKFVECLKSTNKVDSNSDQFLITYIFEHLIDSLDSAKFPYLINNADKIASLDAEASSPYTKTAITAKPQLWGILLSNNVANKGWANLEFLNLGVNCDLFRKCDNKGLRIESSEGYGELTGSESLISKLHLADGTYLVSVCCNLGAITQAMPEELRVNDNRPTPNYVIFRCTVDQMRDISRASTSLIISGISQCKPLEIQKTELAEIFELGKAL